jgi:hypothetical protein
MGMKIQAITTDDGRSVEVGKVYVVDSDEVAGNYKVTHIEIIAAGYSSASGVEVRVEIEWQNEATGFYHYAELPLDAITEEAS